ncbi:NAD(P)H-dependent oxidoreductase [Paracoccus liaowanqingii]|uniref:NAD(P)H-dependent oxidoreductase n=1 Tax=Paracoccus liaowanqingii TaxID=2560053 RepID=A0A4Z1CEH9_9RHOB|nr:NAD(P)H-dependent oxidoreductase [Paracoccus liaowanqingii]TGN50072.1 NAD(P)H-dependent oxidoreductase [Paracoccus liaowanqingii]
MTTILGLAGSLRRASYNAGLLRAVQAIAPQGVTLEIGQIRDVPLYDADAEAAGGIPPAVAALTDQLARADGLLLVSPEYNSGIPGVMKNVLDWMSRGPGQALFQGKPVAVIGASPGHFGTTHAQSHWLPVLRSLNTRPWFEGRLAVSKAGGLFDDEGNLTDPETRGKLSGFVAGFAASLTPKPAAP